MQVKKKIRRLLFSCATILMCLTILVAVAYALFTDNINLTTHITTGDLDITLTRTNLTSIVMGPDGKLTKHTNADHIDFSTPSDDNLFDLYEGIYIVPGVEFKATLLVENNSDMEFGYYIELLVSDDSAQELCEQLLVTITSGDKKVSGTLADLQLGAEDDFISSLKIGDSSTFDIEIIFTDNGNSNAAMDKTVYFDLVVHAIQIPGSQDSSN